ncbi:PREDICTED: pentatricopeptide repeat-containing protein At2g20710, mitochondrial-like [Nicotiana attenuata]|uniref:pentatricopeptide repeat-containing protein At2g20710, mitochondrial-like n=1 Tax=Nicotiana attenuata TaxID=49451 RepID=UPI0009052E89|nr:PREDICTED: pentatricopeptide repeat-containing protein At2g20710, mitochondrial-like [Nicotiana attenuata]XP_019225334.1 PREDICTED: pentatricopeptide repeat-containing protein At2g20710, mitochondrial-like [Nicotiana attenuata]XP_019225335.1 PREDICTED: pentatricopeptide repeat-containing protein At2g20710, mitochondrial-like [Nicotiana attenuata]
MVKNLQQSITGLKLLWSKCSPTSLMVLRFSSYGTNSGTLASSSAAQKEEDDLYQRLLPYAPSTVSMTPIINQWIREGKTVEYTVLKKAIKQLRAYRRFKHALQIYEWMDNSKHLHITPGDVAVRVDLISKAHGLEAAEEYFASIPDNLRSSYVYGALLNCYADAKSSIKAEGTMQKMRDMGDANLLAYNVMMNLYAKMRDLEKLHSLVQEMEDKGIAGNVISYTIRLNAYASVPDVKEMEKLLIKMEENSLLIDWNAYAVVANGYIKAGDVEKASEVLKKCEHLSKGKNARLANESILSLYASMGKKNDVYRIWNKLKNRGKVYSSSYVSMISGLEKLDDIDGAEKIFAEWEAKEVYFDARIPNLLIALYCRKGQLGKAESIIERLLENGKRPNYRTWDRLAGGYYSHNQMEKAVETLKKAILASMPLRKPNIDSWAPCIDYLQSNGDVERAEEIKRLLKERGIFSAGYEKVGELQ